MSGSSPRVWGTWAVTGRGGHYYRFIPTCVGNISFEHSRRSPSSVHPHVCGEHWRSKRHAVNMGGSSPRVWGTFLHWSPMSNPYRFIPTCVGNICLDACAFKIIAVHPHVCGEHDAVTVAGFYNDGSSPRVWGTYFSCYGGVSGHRFIPTCVGNIETLATLLDVSPVHPHVCGEHVPGRERLEIIKGSSPRVWGTYFNSSFATNNLRFIPTCVGNIPGRKSPHESRTVHPHVCGEHSI